MSLAWQLLNNLHSFNSSRQISPMTCQMKWRLGSVHLKHTWMSIKSFCCYLLNKCFYGEDVLGSIQIDTIDNNQREKFLLAVKCVLCWAPVTPGQVTRSLQQIYCGRQAPGINNMWGYSYCWKNGDFRFWICICMLNIVRKIYGEDCTLCMCPRNCMRQTFHPLEPRSVSDW